MISRRLAAALAAVAVVAACGSGSTPTATSTSGSATPRADQPVLVATRCADLVVLGARGSTQSATLNLGVGAEVRLSVQATARRLHLRSTRTVRLQAVRYDASGGAAYTTQVGDGARLLLKDLAAAARACPRTRFAMVGFSEGAQVVHAAALEVPTAIARRVALVAMIADPRRNPGDDITHWTYGSAAPRPGRLGAGTPIGEDVRAAAISLCAPGDEICNGDGSSPGATPSDVHKHFYETPAHVRSTAVQLDDLLRTNGV